jgi:hypothetical protein
MSDKNPTLQDVWLLLGSINKPVATMNKRFGERFDALEREIVALKTDVRTSIGALKESIEARDFRLDDHGHRLNKLEGS